jgi:multidrug efflux pump subunit AcrB
MANILGGTINTMILGGLALAFSRLIDNGIVVLENIFRYMEMGEPPRLAAEKGGTEVSLAVLAATVTTSIVFLPVAALSGVSKYLFTPLALGVVLSMFASYAFAMTVVPLFCAMFIHPSGEVKQDQTEKPKRRFGFQPIVEKFNVYFVRMVNWYERLVRRSLQRPGVTTAGILGGVVVLLVVTFPFLGRAYFPRTDPGQFVINVRMPSGTRLEVSDQYIARVEQIIREEVRPKDLGMIVSNIGVYPDLSAIFTSNASMDTAFVQTSLKEGHSIGSYEYMQRVRDRLSHQMPELTTFFQAGGLIDGVINQGLPAPIDVQVSSMDMNGAYTLAEQLAAKIRTFPNVSGTYIPQDVNYPGIALNIDREKASLIGLSAKDVVDNVITALTSDGMVAPSYWIDPKSGNNYMVTVQYANRWIDNMTMQDFENIPLRALHPAGYSPLDEALQASDTSPEQWVGSHRAGYTPLGSVANMKLINTPTEVDHYQIRRVIDVYVATKSEALGQTGKQIRDLMANTKPDRDTLLTLRGAVVNMNDAFEDFGLGLVIAVGLVYLVLMAQFASFVDPFIILMAIPPGIAGVVLLLLVTGSTLNIMSLMGMIMMTGIVVSKSILIVDFSNILHSQGLLLLDATVEACKMRLRPILMTSMATLLGMIPMAIGAEAGSEQYAPLARAVIGGLGVSVAVTMFLVPAVYLAIHTRQERRANERRGAEA